MKKVIFPFIVLFLAASIGVALIFSRPKPESKPVEEISIPVEVVTAEAKKITLRISSQGTVSPRLEATLAAEVGGLVIETSDTFETGNFVQEGDILVTLDPTDYEAAVAEAKANLRSAQTALTQAEADAEQAVRDLRNVGIENPTPLARREPQLEQARLRVDSAESSLALAEKNLERTRIRAPFDALVVDTLVDRGDVLANRGTPVASLYGTDAAEVALPLSRSEILLLTLPDDPITIAADPESKPAVTFTLGEGPDAAIATGRIDRLAGTADPVTRLRRAIAVIEDPLDLRNGGASTIPFGSFVSAKIEGKEIGSAFRLPVVALVGEDRIRIVDSDNRLREQTVTIVQRTDSEIIVTEGLTDGVEVCLTPLQIFSPGMLVRKASRDGDIDPDSDQPAAAPNNGPAS